MYKFVVLCQQQDEVGITAIDDHRSYDSEKK